jgi:DNA invertase Pin-like site-specific DNA recombinase
MTTALGYTRLSQQSDTSIANQQANIRAYAETHGLTLAEVLSDGEQSSGFDTDELEAYHSLVERVRHGGIGAVIVNDKRRLVRDENEVMRLIADLRSNDVTLHTHQSGQVDLSEPINAAIEILRAATAAEEKRKEIERSKEAIQKKQARGDDLGRPRFGMEYSADGRRQVPGDEFGTVLEVLKLEREGSTYDEIAETTGVPLGTVSRIINRREWYVEREQYAES